MKVYKIVDFCKQSYVVENGCFNCLEYTKDMIVKAVENSMGIFYFKTKNDAKDFLSKCTRIAFMIEVETIGKIYYPKKVPRFIYSSDYNEVPKGTICCEAVKVLDKPVICNNIDWT